MRLKIRCDGESEKFCKIFWELKQGLDIPSYYPERNLLETHILLLSERVPSLILYFYQVRIATYWRHILFSFAKQISNLL